MPSACWTRTHSPNPLAGPESITVPASGTWMGVPIGAAMSRPLWARPAGAEAGGDPARRPSGRRRRRRPPPRRPALSASRSACGALPARRRAPAPARRPARASSAADALQVGRLHQARRVDDHGLDGQRLAADGADGSRSGRGRGERVASAAATIGAGGDVGGDRGASGPGWRRRARRCPARRAAAPSDAAGTAWTSRCWPVAASAVPAMAAATKRTGVDEVNESVNEPLRTRPTRPTGRGGRRSQGGGTRRSGTRHRPPLPPARRQRGLQVCAPALGGAVPCHDLPSGSDGAGRTSPRGWGGSSGSDPCPGCDHAVIDPPETLSRRRLTSNPRRGPVRLPDGTTRRADERDASARLPDAFNLSHTSDFPSGSAVQRTSHPGRATAFRRIAQQRMSVGARDKQPARNTEDPLNRGRAGAVIVVHAGNGVRTDGHRSDPGGRREYDKDPPARATAARVAGHAVR